MPIIVGDSLTELKKLPADHFDCVVSSPPYYGLRDYGAEGQIGLEPTMAEHLEVMVAVCMEVMRVLKPTGTFWLNYGDSYATRPKGAANHQDKSTLTSTVNQEQCNTGLSTIAASGLPAKNLCMIPARLVIALQERGWWVRSRVIWGKPNGMPESTVDRPACAHEEIYMLTKNADNPLLWRHALSLEWRHEKPEPDYVWIHSETDEWTTDAPEQWGRGTPWYRKNLWRGYDNYYDAIAVRQSEKPSSGPRYERGRSDKHKYANGGPGSQTIAKRLERPKQDQLGKRTYTGFNAHWARSTRSREDYEHSPGLNPPHRGLQGAREDWKRRQRGRGPRHSEENNHTALDGHPRGFGRNLRNYEPAPVEVWEIATVPFKGAHFATFPPELVERCLMAGCPKGGHVLDPFGGAGTVGLVADSMGLDWTLIELNPEYAAMAETRIKARIGKAKGPRAELCTKTPSLFE